MDRGKLRLIEAELLLEDVHVVRVQPRRFVRRGQKYLPRVVSSDRD
jgi:hypothetical protein